MKRINPDSDSALEIMAKKRIFGIIKNSLMKNLIS